MLNKHINILNIVCMKYFYLYLYTVINLLLYIHIYIYMLLFDAGFGDMHGSGLRVCIRTSSHFVCPPAYLRESSARIRYLSEAEMQSFWATQNDNLP